MAKGGKSTGYVSKGERSNVARKIKNEMAAERRATPRIADMLKSKKHRQEIIRSPRSVHDKQLAERYLEEERVDFQAWKLLDQYRVVGLTKSAAIQAVKTNYVEHLHSKWSPILKAFQEAKNKK